MYIYPDIVAGFSCEMCGTCCRNDWLVTLDKTSYQRNQKLFASKGKMDEFRQAFVLLHDQTAFGEYAYISKLPDGSCWFLAKEGFCKLHREAGHAHLDNVCQTFPRYPMSTARGLEVTLTFNCPTVFQRISRIDSLKLIRNEMTPVTVNWEGAAVHVFPQQQARNNPLYYYFELEQHFIDILQYRKIPMQERLLFLSATVERIGQKKTAPSLGQFLNQIFFENYEVLEAKTVEIDLPVAVTPEIIAEHFLVNIVFQKSFYIYGLRQGMRLLQGFWQQLEQVRSKVLNMEDDMRITRQTIMAMDFQHSHHRQAVLALQKE